MTRPITFRIWLDGRLIAEPTLEQSTIKIGNANTSHIRLEHPSVSRVHCVIEVGPELEIMDLGSESGTFVNAAPVTRAPVVSGDQLRIGEYLLDVIAAEATNLLGSPLRAKEPSTPPVDAAHNPPLRAPSLLDITNASATGLPAPQPAAFVVTRQPTADPGTAGASKPPSKRADTVELQESDLLDVSLGNADDS